MSLDWTVQLQIHRIVNEALQQAVKKCVFLVVRGLEKKIAEEVQTLNASMQAYLDQQVSERIRHYDMRLAPGISHYAKQVKDMREELKRVMPKIDLLAHAPQLKAQIKPAEGPADNRKQQTAEEEGKLGDTVLTRYQGSAEKRQLRTGLQRAVRSRPRRSLFG